MRRRIVVFPAQIGKISIFNRPGGFAKRAKAAQAVITTLLFD
jgi:hypothetical protein